MPSLLSKCFISSLSIYLTLSSPSRLLLNPFVVLKQMKNLTQGLSHILASKESNPLSLFVPSSFLGTDLCAAGKKDLFFLIV